MILADRKTLKCPNGVVLGTPGSGKSFSCKREAADVYLHTTDDLLFLDPENEYTSLCQQLSGQVIRLAPDSHDYINPLDVDLTTNTGENPLLMKADFIMSFCELILSAAQGGLKPIEKSVIDRCIPKIYRQLIKDPRPENMPILGDLYECLRAQQEEQAQELATALELYVFGSLNYLNHRTNVNVDNRVACYDISGLGQNLKKPGMLTVQNNIWQRTIVNRYAKGNLTAYLNLYYRYYGTSADFGSEQMAGTATQVVSGFLRDAEALLKQQHPDDWQQYAIVAIGTSRQTRFVVANVITEQSNSPVSIENGKVSFADVTFGIPGAWAEYKLTITNNGTVNANLSGAVIALNTENSDQLTLKAPDLSDETLKPGESCTVTFVVQVPESCAGELNATGSITVTLPYAQDSVEPAPEAGHTHA